MLEITSMDDLPKFGPIVRSNLDCGRLTLVFANHYIVIEGSEYYSCNTLRRVEPDESEKIFIGLETEESLAKAREAARLLREQDSQRQEYDLYLRLRKKYAD